ncbi:Eco57I restriction-modification methylase domain-containing protein [Ekhidna sp.]|uniref:type IIG restriction enzyme/methyltransferase n=1 Tax=Ekhidna sp. TaxID=2608089 RepID=UPI0035148CBE
MFLRKLANVLNPAYKKVPVDKAEMDVFITSLNKYLKALETDESEEHYKTPLRDLLNEVYYKNEFAINTKGRADFVIFNGKTDQTSAGVLVETKKPNSSDMVTEKSLDNRSMHELMLYYMRERVDHENNELKHLIITDFYQWYVFDAVDFYNLIYQNTAFRKKYKEWNTGQTDSEKTNSFYKDIASPFIKEIQAELPFTHFDLRNYLKASERKQVNLYKFLSPEHLLKKPFANDSNTLNRAFYNELLHLIGLEEEGKSKKVINRKAEDKRNEGSLVENAIHAIERDVNLTRVENLNQYGATNEEQRYQIALELCITWINRILFLKLLEAQLVSYHDGDAEYKFLSSERIPDWDELNKLFFDVLAVQTHLRHSSVKEAYTKVPYLNSSLFERTELEEQTILISNLDNTSLPLRPGSVLGKEKDAPKTLTYLFRFLDAYDFSSEGKEQVIREKKSLINASVLGLIFEKINGYKDGSFFTPGFITMYMCRETLRRAVVQKFNEVKGWKCETLDDLYDKIEDRKEANDIINSLHVIDPAVGSGHFLVSALNELIVIKHELKILQDRDGKRLKEYQITIENDELHIQDDDGDLFEYTPGNAESQRVQETLFHEKQTLIENCLFGVDINPNSVKICRLRLWIELLKHAYYRENSPPSKGGAGGGSSKIMNLPELKSFRRQLRSNLTPAEATLWKMLQKSQLDGRKFRRQHSVGKYILDFYCPSEKLAVELDGDGHLSLSQMEYDMERDAFIEQFGIKVIRIENHWVFDQPEAVLQEIRNEFGWSERIATLPAAPGDVSSDHPGLRPPLLNKEGNAQNQSTPSSPPSKGGVGGGLETLPNIDINIKTGNSLISRFGLDEDLSEVFKKQQFSIQTYRDAVAAYKETNDKTAKAELQAFIKKIKEQFRSSVLNRDPLVKKIADTRGKITLLESNIDLFGEPMDTKKKDLEIARLKKLLAKHEQEREDQLNDTIYQNAFEWRFEFPEVLDDQGDYVGFDVCIGNPPYIRQEEIKDQKPYLKTNYKLFTGASDLYIFFIEKGFQILKENGQFTFIMPNKFMQAGYGEPARKFLLKHQLEEIVDFGDLQVFDEATTYPLILRSGKSEPVRDFKSLKVPDLSIKDYFNEWCYSSSNLISQDFLSAETWIISNPEEQDLLTKVKESKKSLGSIIKGEAKRGILTGLSEAFVHNTSQLNTKNLSREELKLTHPFLLGREVQPYSPVSPKNSLIKIEKGHSNVQRGQEDPEIWFSKTLPSLYKLLQPFAERAKKRTDKGDYYWELRACDYYDLFEKPKIMYQKFQVKPCFIYDTEGLYCNDSMWIIPTEDLSLLGILNSKMGWWLISKYCTAIQNGYQLIWKYFSQIPIATPSDTQRTEIETLVTSILEAKKKDPKADTSKEEAKIDQLVYALYGLNEEEIEIIENSVK